jgi:hypothetical protein
LAQRGPRLAARHRFLPPDRSIMAMIIMMVAFFIAADIERSAS